MSITAGYPPNRCAATWPATPATGSGGCLARTLPSAAAARPYERAKAAGAEIIAEPHDTDYGSHDFAARDPEGNRWSFGTYRGEPRKTA